MIQVCVVGQHIYTEWPLLPVYDELRRQNFDVQLVQTYRNEQLIDAEAYLYSTMFIDKEAESRSFFIPHSMTDEPLHGRRASFVPGPYFASQEYLKKWLRSGNVIQTGWPRLDCLFKCEKPRLKLPYKKTILYAPTQNLDALLPLVDICKRLKINLIIKTHYLLKGKECSNLGINVIWLSPEKIITPLYHISDILISDISSVLREFISVDKPTIQLLTDINNQDYYKGMLHSSIEDLEDTVKRTLDNPDEIVEERREWREKLFFKLDGYASIRVVETLKKEMKWRVS